MTILTFPTIPAATIDWQFAGVSASFASPFTGDEQTAANPGSTRMIAVLTWKLLSRAEAADLESALVASSLLEYYRGRSLKIWIAFVDENGQIVGEPVGPWRWRMSTLDGEFGGQSGKLVLSAGSRMAMWEKSSVRRYTDEDQRAEYPDDFFCEFASASAEREIEF